MKFPDLTPPKPVGQNVGAAKFMDALQIGSTIIQTGMSVASPFIIAAAGSDRRLKENIKKLGDSPSGLGIYKFNYIGHAKK